MYGFKRSLLVLALSALTSTTTSSVFAQATDVQSLPGDVAGVSMVPFQAAVHISLPSGQPTARLAFTALPAVADYTIETVTLHMRVPEDPYAASVALITNLGTDPRTELQHYLSFHTDGQWPNIADMSLYDIDTGTHSVRLHSAVRPSVRLSTLSYLPGGGGGVELDVTIAGYMAAASAGP